MIREMSKSPFHYANAEFPSAESSRAGKPHLDLIKD